MTVRQLSDGKGMTADVLDSVVLYSLFVTLRLGESRDVVLGLNDRKRYVRRRDKEFAPPKSVYPYFSVQENALIVDYPEGEEPEGRILFNLKGHGVGNIEDHNLTIFADRFLDSENCCSVLDTPLDFRVETPIGERIRVGFEPLVRQKGYDHIFILDKSTKQDFDADGVIKRKTDLDVPLTHAATLMDRMRTIQMDVYTSFPALHLYTGNRMSGRDIGKGGCIYPNRGGVALMPCGSPDGCGRVEYRFQSLL